MRLRLALYKTPSGESISLSYTRAYITRASASFIGSLPYPYFLRNFLLPSFLFIIFLCFCDLCFHWDFEDVPLIFSCTADYVSYCQPRITQTDTQPDDFELPSVCMSSSVIEAASFDIVGLKQRSSLSSLQH